MKKPIMAFMLLLTAAISFNPAAHAKIALGELDANMLFGQSSLNVEVMALSEREMVETEGAAVPLLGILPLLKYAGGGAVIGGGIYTGTTTYRSWDNNSVSGTVSNFQNNFSGRDFGFAVGAGAVGGAYGQALFRGVGYTGFRNQITAPISVQTPIRSGSAGLGFTTFGVHGYPSSNFNSSFSNNTATSSSFQCYSCYRSGR